MNKLHAHKLASGQRGAVLAVSLILLAILTVIGTTAMNTSVLQNTMASNFQFQIGAMENAELTLQASEEDIDDVLDLATATGFEVFDTPNNHYHMAAADTIDPNAEDWGAYSPKSTADGIYVIEYAGVVPIGGGSLGIGGGGVTADNFRHVFLISARGETGNGASRTVQTTVVKQVE